MSTRTNSPRRQSGEKYIELRGCRLCDDAPFIQPYRYRQIRRIDMGPIVAAALDAVFERRWRRAV